MAQAERTAEVTWKGKLTDGSGTLNAGSGALGEQKLTWSARTEQSDGNTSPEELIAAAHASCYSMALSATLTRAGSPPEEIHTSAVVALDPKEGGGFQIGSSKLTVEASVPGIDQAKFEELARTAEQNCPVSNALRNNLEITLDARLKQ